MRQQAEDKIYSRLTYTRELKQRNPRTVVALMGCLVGKNPAEMARLQARFPFVDIFLPPSDLTPLRDYLLTRGLQPPAAENPDDWPPPPLPDSATGRAGVAPLPIGLGCSHACTYCVIPYRRGGEHSRPSAQILAEATRLAERGIREITLLGQIVDRYGLDLPDEIHLPELLRRVAAIPGLLRVRFLTSHPRWITPELIATVAETPKLCPYFEIPVQAGSDAILSAMRRGYTVAEYEALIARLRAAIPHVGLSTDVIVGFPGETNAQFEESRALMRRINPDMIRIAKYSPPSPTRAPPARRRAETEKERRRIAMETQLRDRLTEKMPRRPVGRSPHRIHRKSGPPARTHPTTNPFSLTIAPPPASSSKPA